MRVRLAPIIALGVLSLVWGYNWVVMKQALRFVDPFTFSALRSILGALALFGVIRLRRGSFSLGSFGGVAVLGLMQTTLFVTLSTWALVSGGAGKTAVLVYTMPLWLLILAWPLLGERLRGLQWVSVLLAFGGLLSILQPWRIQSKAFSIALALAGAVCWAASGIWVKRLRRRVKVDLLALTAWQLLIGSLPLFPIAWVVTDEPITWSWYFIGALAYNAIPATAVAWLLWLYALHELPAGQAGMGTLLTPVVGVTAAWLQLGEAPRPLEAAGMALIFAGLAVLIAQRINEGRLTTDN